MSDKQVARVALIVEYADGTSAEFTCDAPERTDIDLTMPGDYGRVSGSMAKPYSLPETKNAGALHLAVTAANGKPLRIEELPAPRQDILAAYQKVTGLSVADVITRLTASAPA